jgi:hypothetical protein
VYQDTVLVNTACEILITTLMQAPFNHEWGASIQAKIIAFNSYGDSEYSALGNGAIITTYPDAPLTLAEDYSQRSSTQLSFTWLEGAANGGASVIDYTFSYDQGTDTYVVLADGILALNYLSINLTPGQIYKFKV